MSDELKKKIADLEGNRDSLRERIKKAADLRADLRAVERELVEAHNALARHERDSGTAT